MNINSTTLEQWRVFQAVVDCGSFAKAAEHLFKSQSTVSYSVKKLQSQLDTQLFTLVGKRAVLTEQGELFLSRSRLLTRQAEELETLVTNVEQGWEHTIHLIVESAFPANLLYKILKKFEPLSKGTRIQYSESILSGTEEAMADNNNDLVISPVPSATLMCEPILSFEFIAVSHPNNQLIQKNKKITLLDLEESLQIVAKDSGNKSPVDIGWLNAKQRWTVSNLETVKSMVLNNLGIAWLPEHMIQKELLAGELVTLPLESNTSYRANLYLVYVKNKPIAPASKLLSKIIIDECKRSLYYK